MCLCGKWNLDGTKLRYNFEIDIRILTLRAISFFQTTAGSSIGRFLVVFLNNHFNPQQIGILSGIQNGIGWLASFLWGFIGDCTDRHLLCLLCGLITSTVCINGLVSNIIQDNFWYALSLMSFVTMAGSAGCLFDALTLLILGEKKDKDKHSNNQQEESEDESTKDYGLTRFWGAFGWGLGALICGLLLHLFGENFLFYFYDATYSIPIIIMIISSSYLTYKRHDTIDEKDQRFSALQVPQRGSSVDSNDEKHIDDSGKNRLDTKTFRKNVCTSYGFLFFMNLLLFGICMAFVESYLFLFLINYFHATTILCGCTVAAMVLGELPMFYNSKWLINNIGILGLLSIAHIAYVIRVFGYTLLPQKQEYSWFVLLLEPLHGLTFGGMWIASVEYGSKLAPPSMQGTMQGLINGVWYQLAQCFGTIGGGFIFHHLGPVWMYRMAGFVIAGWMVFFQISLRIIKCCDNSRGIQLLFKTKASESKVQLLNESENKLVNKS
eukprot:178055_1